MSMHFLGFEDFANLSHWYDPDAAGGPVRDHRFVIFPSFEGPHARAIGLKQQQTEWAARRALSGVHIFGKPLQFERGHGGFRFFSRQGAAWLSSQGGRKLLQLHC